MNRSTICAFLVLSLLLASSAAGQSASIHQQIQQTYNFQPHLLSNQQITEKSAALHVLKDPHFTVFIPQHVLTLGQNYVLIYLLLSTDQDYWLQPAMERLKTEHDETAQKSLLLLLWYAQTDAADQAMSAFAGDASKPSASRTYARELVDRKDKIGSKEQTQASDPTEASLRQKRRERLKAVSDEALIDLDDFTLMLIAKRK